MSCLSKKSRCDLRKIVLNLKNAVAHWDLLELLELAMDCLRRVVSYVEVKEILGTTTSAWNNDQLNDEDISRPLMDTFAPKSVC